MTFPECPYCKIAVRIRDLRFVGREIACPGCHEKIVPTVQGTEHWQLLTVEEYQKQTGARAENTAGAVKGNAVALATASSTTSKTAAASKAKAEAAPTVVRQSFTVFKSPLLLAWCGASVVTLLIVIGIIQQFSVRPGAVVAQDPEQSTAGETPTDGNSAADNQAPKAAGEASKPPTPPSHEKLARLGNWLAEETTRTGAFPRGVTGPAEVDLSDQWGWISQYVEGVQPTSSVPNRQRQWKDASNDRFVRRRIDGLLINESSGLVGGQGYPATQLVGIAGVTRQGPELNKDHPLAGVFAYHRSTRMDDILDGLSQTATVATVSNHLGTWAGSGDASVRPLTASPAVGGPDGFGIVGQSGMMMLMADGSVRELSDKTHDSIVHRMMTMAEGVDLNSSETTPTLAQLALAQPGSQGPLAQNNPVPPATSSEVTQLPPVAPMPMEADAKNQDPGPEAEKNHAAQPAAQAQVPQERPVEIQQLDLQAGLKDVIPRFRTKESQTRIQVARVMAGYLGGTVQLPKDLAPEAQESLMGVLQGAISMDVEKLTVQQILDDVFEQTPVTWRIEGATLTIAPVESVAPPKEVTEPTPESKP